MSLLNLKNRTSSGLKYVVMLAFSLSLIFRTGASSMDSNQFQDLNRVPDTISAVLESGTVELQPGADNLWRGGGVTVSIRKQHGGLTVELTAPEIGVKNLLLRWKANLAPEWKYLGDAWERAYGDLEWKPLDGRRVMPWYFLASNGKLTHGYGVKTGPSALCHWTADASGITLHADVRCGGSSVLLGQRQLEVCTVICRRGHAGETPFAAAEAFCGQMCAKPRLPTHPVYGFNDWYCSYGNDTAEEFLKNAGFMAALAPKNQVRPFAVVDDGWEEEVERTTKSNYWKRINPRFSKSLDMPQFAESIRGLGERPGLWFRPLLSPPDCPKNWRLARDSKILDPTVPEVRSYVIEKVSRFKEWGFELVKHDFTTFDLLGKWGMDMGDEVTSSGWSFADRSLTTAEVIRNLYLDIRKAAGPKTLILGCNVIGHLSAGIFEMQRIGDDTSGREWDRTRKMGVNSLAFRAPQHNHFFAVDADCAGQTTADSLPWEKNSQWLELLAHSGTVFFTSFPRNILNPAQELDLKSALSAAAKDQPLAQPLDWMNNRTPEHWLLDGKAAIFSW
jgi:alpha-galactosidase